MTISKRDPDARYFVSLHAVLHRFLPDEQNPFPGIIPSCRPNSPTNVAYFEGGIYDHEPDNDAFRRCRRCFPPDD